MYVPHFIYLFTVWCSFGLLLLFDHCEQWCCEDLCTSFCLNTCSEFSWNITRCGIGGSYGNSLFNIFEVLPNKFITVFLCVIKVFVFIIVLILLIYLTTELLYDIVNLLIYILVSSLSTNFLELLREMIPLMEKYEENL